MIPNSPPLPLHASVDYWVFRLLPLHNAFHLYSLPKIDIQIITITKLSLFLDLRRAARKSLLNVVFFSVLLYSPPRLSLAFRSIYHIRPLNSILFNLIFIHSDIAFLFQQFQCIYHYLIISFFYLSSSALYITE